MLVLVADDEVVENANDCRRSCMMRSSSDHEGLLSKSRCGGVEVTVIASVMASVSRIANENASMTSMNGRVHLCASLFESPFCLYRL